MIQGYMPSFCKLIKTWLWKPERRVAPIVVAYSTAPVIHESQKGSLCLFMARRLCVTQTQRDAPGFDPETGRGTGKIDRSKPQDALSLADVVARNLSSLTVLEIRNSVFRAIVGSCSPMPRSGRALFRSMRNSGYGETVTIYFATELPFTSGGDASSLMGRTDPQRMSRRMPT
jgi:hypothetical protein